MKSLTRRTLLKSTTGFIASAIAVPKFIPSSALGRSGSVAPSERLTMGGIGIGGQGMHNLRNFVTCDDLRIIAVCDVDTKHRIRAKQTVDAAYSNRDCAAYNDVREILARDDVDTVLIATPDHWHAILSIEAAKAGKHIYCEKPISLTIAEGRAVADTIKRYGTVYQSGTQRRSNACFRFGVDIARNGMLGRLHTLHCYYHNGPTCSPQKTEPVPKGFDYDRCVNKKGTSAVKYLKNFLGQLLVNVYLKINEVNVRQFKYKTTSLEIMKAIHILVLSMRPFNPLYLLLQ